MGKIASKIIVQGNEVNFTINNDQQFVSLTDIARYKDKERSDYVLQNWLRNRNTIEFIGLWEKLNNPSFNSIEFDGIKIYSGLNSFSLTPKRWVESTNAIGIISRSGRYGGTFAHLDIAFEFASWISPEFKLYLITEFKRLKRSESKHSNLDWNLQRTIAKINYRIQTDAIKENLIPKEITNEQSVLIYANEADLLNIALFGLTAKEWKSTYPKNTGNIRDDATLIQLVVLSNLESINALLITQNLTQAERLLQLNKTAILQMRSLVKHDEIKKLKK